MSRSRQTQRARSEGHELFLQAPMEPFDYPDNDPGPQTLLVLSVGTGVFEFTLDREVGSFVQTARDQPAHQGLLKVVWTDDRIARCSTLQLSVGQGALHRPDNVVAFAHPPERRI